METTTIKMEVPTKMLPYINGGVDKVKQYAMFLYPYIQNETISHGKAAEILGLNKLELIMIYDSMGLPYFQETGDELAEDLKTLRKVCGARQ